MFIDKRFVSYGKTLCVIYLLKRLSFSMHFWKKLYTSLKWRSKHSLPPIFFLFSLRICIIILLWICQTIWLSRHCKTVYSQYRSCRNPRTSSINNCFSSNMLFSISIPETRFKKKVIYRSRHCKPTMPPCFCMRYRKKTLPQ